VIGLLGTAPEAIRAQYTQADLPRAMAGGYLEALATLVFLAVAAFLYRVTGRDQEPAGWLSLTAFGAAVLYSTTTGLAVTGAALYRAQHRADTTAVVAALNNLRDFLFSLSFLPLGVFTCAVAAMALPRGTVLPRWIGWIGLPIGLAQFVGAAGAGLEWQNFTYMLWFAWFVALGVTGRGSRRRPNDERFAG
jgi:hypothetical protein